MQQQQKHVVFDANGRVVDGKVVPDGAKVVVPPMMMDGRTVRAPAADAGTGRHSPGSLPITDADRQRRQEFYRKRDTDLSERWKHTAPSVTETVQLEQVKHTATASPAPDLGAAYARRDQELSQRWKKGGAA